MDYEVQVGWGKAVPIPPHPIYVPPDLQEEEKSKVPDPPSGLPFNAQVFKKSSVISTTGQYGNVSLPGGVKEAAEHVPSLQQDFEDNLYNSVVRVVIPTDNELLRLIHRMIEFVIREGPMFEAMIMNKEFHNPKFQFLFENQSPAHVYYRWKLFSILQGDSPETWRTEEFRMFEGGSLWKPPPLKNLRSKVLPPIEGEIVKKGQLSSKRRDELEDLLRNISVEREKIKNTMIWCLDRAESSEEIVECITESLCITETPLPMKIARLYLVSDILLNCSTSVPNVSNFRRGFESKIMAILEHFHDVLISITSRIRAEQFKRRVLACLRSWDQMSVYHFHLVDKLREVFIGKTQEELEKQKAFETVAALMTSEEMSTDPVGVDSMPLLDDQPIDFSKVTCSIDGVPMEDDNLDGEPLISHRTEDAAGTDIDGIPMDLADAVELSSTAKVAVTIKSKWELVDYGDDSDNSESSSGPQLNTKEISTIDKEKQQLMAEVDERKRRMLRDVELKVVELTDALESSGSYTKAEISERVAKFRDKLMQEAVEPKSSPLRNSPSNRERSRSPSPSTIAKYSLEDSTQQMKSHSQDQKWKKFQSCSRSPSRKHSIEGHSKHLRSKSPSKRRSRSRSHSPLRKQSPSRKRSRSRSASPHRNVRSSKHKSPKSRRHRSRSHSPKRSKKRSRSRSPHKSKSNKKKH